MKKDNVVWSKPNCTFCVKAKDLLDQNNIEYSENEIGNGFTKEQLLEVVPTARSVPQIFLDGKHVGGFDSLESILKGE
jgi:glutaredoxin 3|tara:strand:- start:98 stop:331 length:234 start_codon:yes stop_codon:yes gene_type:complete